MSNEFVAEQIRLVEIFEPQGAYKHMDVGELSRLANMPFGDMIAVLARPLQGRKPREISAWQSDVLNLADISDVVNNFSSYSLEEKVAIVKRLKQKADNYYEEGGY